MPENDIKNWKEIGAYKNYVMLASPQGDQVALLERVDNKIVIGPVFMEKFRGTEKLHASVIIEVSDEAMHL